MLQPSQPGKAPTHIHVAERRGVGGGWWKPSSLQWLRVGAITEEIEDATSDLYKLRVEDVGCTVACRVTPARSDGVVGQPVVQPLPVGEVSASLTPTPPLTVPLTVAHP